MPPTALLDKLQAIGRRIRMYGIALGAGRVIACAVAVLLAAVFIDWAVHATTISPGGLPGPGRLAMLLIALGLVLYAAIRWVARPALARYSPGDVAGWIEERYPQFGDALRSTVNFLSADVPGSRQMKERVVSQAAERIEQTDLAAVIDPRPFWYSSATAVAAIVVLLGLAIAVPPGFPIGGIWHYR